MAAVVVLYGGLILPPLGLAVSFALENPAASFLLLGLCAFLGLHLWAISKGDYGSWLLALILCGAGFAFGLLGLWVSYQSGSRDGLLIGSGIASHLGLGFAALWSLKPWMRARRGVG